MSLDGSLIAYCVRNDALAELQRAGVSLEHFSDDYQPVWRYILRQKREHDVIPSEDTLLTRFPELDLPRVRKSELPILLKDLRLRRKYKTLLLTLNEIATTVTSFDEVDSAIQTLQGKLNELSFQGEGQSHLVDLFDHATTMRLVQDIKRRRRGEVVGIPSGLARYDREAGGLQKQKMVVIIGRPGLGKSWLDLLFVAKAVMSGYKVLLYPLEMTLAETAFRLWTLFTQQMFGADRVLRNMDLNLGRVSPRKVVQLLHALEDRFAGQLLVADVGSLADPYTNERIEAEVEMHTPDMFWVDYITLMKMPERTRGGDSDWIGVRALSNGIKNTAMRRNVVGGCSAQVNREALKTNTFLPRLENIAFGDSIGMDADQVFSINKAKGYLYYSLVKNRGGREIPKTRVAFNVDHGILEERPEEEADADS